MDRLLLDSTRVMHTGGGVSEVAAGLGREINTMRGVLGQLQSGWKSSTAAPSFARTMNAYLADAQLLHQALVSHGATLTTSGHTIAQTEDTIAIGGGR